MVRVMGENGADVLNQSNRASTVSNRAQSVVGYRRADDRRKPHAFLISGNNTTEDKEHTRAREHPSSRTCRTHRGQSKRSGARDVTHAFLISTRVASRLTHNIR